MARESYEEAVKINRLDTYNKIANEYDKLIDEAIHNRWESIQAEYADSGLDPADERADDAEMLRLFKYRMTLMIICCLCETWEQDLYNYLKENNIINSCDNDFDKISKVYKRELNIDINKYNKLIEMRTMVNSIKHGNGRSFDRLRQKLGDNILADSWLGIIDKYGRSRQYKERKFDDNTLTSITLNCNNKTNEYNNAIISFWEDVYKEMDKTKAPNS